MAELFRLVNDLPRWMWQVNGWFFSQRNFIGFNPSPYEIDVNCIYRRQTHIGAVFKTLVG